MSWKDEADGPNSKGVAFGLWLGGLVGACGMHRFYLGRPGTGLLYLFTFGLLGIGQLIDLVRLPAMVAEENTKHAALKALEEKRALAAMRARMLPAPPSTPAMGDQEQIAELRIKLVTAAAAHNGRLTVTQAVMATGRDFAEIEAILDKMAESRYVGIDNDSQTGAVVYTFGEL